MYFNVRLLVLVQEDLFKMELIQLLDKFQQNLNILTDINTTMGMVFVKQREFVQKLKGTHIITLLKEILLILFKIK